MWKQRKNKMSYLDLKQLLEGQAYLRMMMGHDMISILRPLKDINLSTEDQEYLRIKVQLWFTNETEYND